MRQQLIGSGYVIGALLGACMLLHASAQDGQAAPSAPAVSTAPEAGGSSPVKTVGASGKKEDGQSGAEASPAVKYSDGVEEVLKMVQAGISTEVVKTYIESSPVVYSLSAADIIALKKHEVPDELTTAMMKRGAALKTQVREAMALNSQRPVYSGGSRRYYGMDPEGYDYFQYHYLYPRTLAAANQSFYSSGPFFSGIGSYGYGYGPGYYGPPAYWPMRPSAFGHP